MIPHAGDIFRSGKRHVRVEQVRSSGAGGLKYALVRFCGPAGRTHRHPILGDEPINVWLYPNGEMPRGYIPAGRAVPS